MITLRRGDERRHDRGPKQETWLTFCSQDREDPLADGFGALEVLNEGRLSPGAGLLAYPHRDAGSVRDAEIVTYVREGALAYKDSMGRSGIVQAGEFQRMTVGRGMRHRERSASQTNGVHVFQVWLPPAETEVEPSHEQRRFSAAERRGLLCAVASANARRSSLRIHQDAVVYSTLLDPGQHVVHQLTPGRTAWLHLVVGEVALGDVVLTTGDGAGLTGEHAVSLTAREESEILLLDLGGHTPRPERAGERR